MVPSARLGLHSPCPPPPPPCAQPPATLILRSSTQQSPQTTPTTLFYSKPGGAEPASAHNSGTLLRLRTAPARGGPGQELLTRGPFWAIKNYAATARLTHSLKNKEVPTTPCPSNARPTLATTTKILRYTAQASPTNFESPTTPPHTTAALPLQMRRTAPDLPRIYSTRPRVFDVHRSRPVA